MKCGKPLCLQFCIKATHLHIKIKYKEPVYYKRVKILILVGTAGILAFINCLGNYCVFTLTIPRWKTLKKPRLPVKGQNSNPNWVLGFRDFKNARETIGRPSLPWYPPPPPHNKNPAKRNLAGAAQHCCWCQVLKRVLFKKRRPAYH
jgi:hypothetical protein